MRNLRAVLLAWAVATGATAAAAAQDAAAEPSAEALAAARDLVAILSGDLVQDMAGKVNVQAWPKIEQGLRSQYPNLDAATTAELRQEFENYLRRSMNEAMADAPAIYARHLSVAEMHDIETFYRTPSGAKTLRVMPLITGEVMANMAPRIQDMMQNMTTSFTGILKSHGYN